MKHQFPKKIPLPSSVRKERSSRKKEIQQSAAYGILIRLSIIAFELAGVYWFGSAALLMDAIASLFDVAATAVLIFFVWLAARPPDPEHPFGHGRYEPLIGLQLGLSLVVIGGWALITHAGGLNFSSEQQIDSRAWLIPLLAVILLEGCYQLVMYTARKRDSPALAADAFHYRIDALTSLLATFALGLGALYPTLSNTLDHWGAILIAVLMIVLGVVAARKNLNQLMDRIPEEKFFILVKNAALKVKGVHDTEKTRIMLYGPDAHVDIDIEVDPHASVEAAHALSQKVRAEIQKAWPAVRDVTVHIEPYYPNDH